MQEGVVDPHQRETRGSTETVLPQIPPPGLNAGMGPGPVELDSEQRMGRMLTVQLLVDHEVEVSPEGVAPVTLLEPGMRRTERPGQFPQTGNGEVSQARSDGRGHLRVLGGRPHAVEHPGLLRDGVAQGRQSTVQSSEGLNLGRSAKGHGTESSHRRTTARPPRAIPDSRLVGSVEDPTSQEAQAPHCFGPRLSDRSRPCPSEAA
jgi:hypothetical protein